MIDTIVSLEVAKLAKEKGFNIITSSMYAITGQLQPYSEVKNTLYRDYCMAPTQALVAKWLREIHNIHLFITPIGRPVQYLAIVPICYRPNTKDNNIDSPFKPSSTYEEALEHALTISLNLL